MNIRYLPALMAVASMALVPATTFAQSEGDDSGTLIEEIIVTAQKREQSLRDVPISISVATREQLERDQIYTLVDLQRAAPGLEVSPTAGGEAAGGGRVRGIGTNLFSEGASASVAVVVDQMPSGNLAMPEIFDLAQVEVLRGPQGTLFGQSASAGVINISSVAPDPSAFSGEVGADYQWDDYSQRVVRAAVNVPISENSALRIAARSNSLSGAKINVLRDQEDEDDVTSLRVRYRLQPSDALSIDLIAEYHDKAGHDNFFNYAIPPTVAIRAPWGAPLSPEAQLRFIAGCGDAGPYEVEPSARAYCIEGNTRLEKQWSALGAIIDWDVADHTLTSVTSYREKDLNNVYRNYSRVYNQFAAQLFNYGEAGDQITQELRIASSEDLTFRYLAGLYFADYNYNTAPTGGTVGDLSDPTGFLLCNESRTACAGPPTYRPTFEFAEAGSSTQAVFADGEFDLGETATLFGGLRYTSHDSSYARGDNGPFTHFGGKENNDTSGRLGVRWRVGDDGTVYASVSRGFKPSYVSISPDPEIPVTVLDPEINTSWEVGGKFGLADGRLSLDASLFNMSVEGYQAQAQSFTSAGLVAVPTNIPEVASKGLELSLYGSISDQLSINAGYLYNNAQYPDGYLSDDANALGGPVDLGGRQVEKSPERKLTLSGEWFTPVGGNLEAFVNLNVIHVSDILLGPLAQPEYLFPAHARWGGSLGVRSGDGRWSARLFGRNLGDEPFPLAALGGYLFGPSNANGSVRLWTWPGVSFRQVGFTFDANF